MNWLSQAVADFLQGLGFASLGLDSQGYVRLRTDAGGAIELQQVRDESSSSLMLAWSEPDPWQLSEHLKAALRLADFRSGGTLQLMVASHADQLVLATRLPERSVTRSALEECAQWLQQVHEQIRNS